jgi:hypothetical protein
MLMIWLPVKRDFFLWNLLGSKFEQVPLTGAATVREDYQKVKTQGEGEGEGGVAVRQRTVAGVSARR